MTNGYITRDQLLAAATTLVEQDIHIPSLGGSVRIRELTGQQRQDANRAAQTDDPDAPDNARYRAIIVQMGVVSPALTPADVEALANGRENPVNRLAVAILSLSEMLPADLFRSGEAAHTGQHDTDDSDLASGSVAG